MTPEIYGTCGLRGCRGCGKPSRSARSAASWRYAMACLRKDSLSAGLDASAAILSKFRACSRYSAIIFTVLTDCSGKRKPGLSTRACGFGNCLLHENVGQVADDDDRRDRPQNEDRHGYLLWPPRCIGNAIPWPGFRGAQKPEYRRYRLAASLLSMAFHKPLIFPKSSQPAKI